MAQYPKVIHKSYWLHRVSPLDTFKTVKNVGGTDNLSYAISRCKKLAEGDKDKDYIVSYRVLSSGGQVLFLSTVDFGRVNHYDMRDKPNAQS